jgi:aromatic ring-opening dioxygenase catalytic subunit (LigB family)
MDPPPDEPLRWVAMRDYLASLPGRLPGRPEALLVISAHWEMPRPTVLSGAAPALLFDYFNFPAYTYRLTYPAPGAPSLAAKVRARLAEAGIDSDEDAERGFDHGIFIPLKVSFPAADVPILQLSLQAGLDPLRHMAIGRALSTLREENIAIIGSGLSFHNLSALGNPALNAPAAEFDRWLQQTLCETPVEQRDAAIANWTHAPHARLCHPREEHLMPLMVAVGAAALDAGRRTFSGNIWGKPVSAFHFD